MNAIIENNKVRLVTEYTTVNCTITVPFMNIEKMKKATNCKIQKVEETKVDFNHNAGKLAKVTLLVQFRNIEKYLNDSDAIECQNFESYLDLLGKPQGRYSNLYHSERFLLNCDKAKLYAFGNFNLNYKYNAINSHYVNVDGKKISLNNKTDKYVNFKGQWFRKVA